MNPFTPQQELRFARVAARVTRRLPRDVQQEVFAAAYIKARETYGDFDATRGDGTIESRLDNWFYGLVWNAKKKIRRESQSLGASEALEAMTGGDDPEAEAIRDEVFKQLSAEDLAIVATIQGDASVRQAARKFKVTVSHVKHLKRLVRSHLQVTARAAPVVRREPTEASDDDMRNAAPIDHEIEKLLRRPSTEKADCPICWKCAYFDGLLPVRYAAKEFADPEVTEAILRTELRKQDIANHTAPRDEPDDLPVEDVERKRRNFYYSLSFSSRNAWDHIKKLYARPSSFVGLGELIDQIKFNEEVSETA